jgi:hypothetical protein
MTVLSLPAALRAGAEGLYALEAATGLIIAHGTWLERDDFTCRFIRHGTGTKHRDLIRPTAPRTACLHEGDSSTASRSVLGWSEGRGAAWLYEGRRSRASRLDALNLRQAPVPASMKGDAHERLHRVLSVRVLTCDFEVVCEGSSPQAALIARAGVPSAAMLLTSGYGMRRVPGFLRIAAGFVFRLLHGRHAVGGDRAARSQVLHRYVDGGTGRAAVADKDAVLVGFDEFCELRAYPDQLRWAAVQDEDAELHPIAVGAEQVRDLEPSAIVRYVVGDQVAPGGDRLSDVNRPVTKLSAVRSTSLRGGSPGAGLDGGQRSWASR